ncbi:hypothetical protein ACHAXT_008110 [Thalassiosira profunda]
MAERKRPRHEDDGTSSSASPTIKLLETELKTLRSELSHSQSLRALERKNAARAETRLKRQLADAADEAAEARELAVSLREQVEAHGRTMEESRGEWMERIKWYEERWEEVEEEREGGGGYGSEEAGASRADVLQKRLDAALEQVKGLEASLKQAEKGRVAAEERSAEAQRQAAESRQGSSAGDENAPEIPRELRIKVAETERANRELRRENEAMKTRAKDMLQHKERAASSKRRVQQLEKEVQNLTHQLEEGREAQRQWRAFRAELVEEGLAGENDERTSTEGSAVPPEIATVVRKFKGFKQKAKRQEDEIARITQLSEAHLRRCKVLEAQSAEKSLSLSTLEKTVQEREATIGQLELENRKVAAQQAIWKRESEGMRALLDTYEEQETVQSKSPTSKRSNPDGLRLSLDAAREELALLSDTNQKLEATIEGLKAERQSSQGEHDRVLEKFGKLRAALMDERAKAEAAEMRASEAETRAGKGSYSDETTRVVHLKANPLSEAVRAKYEGEIDALKQRLEEAEANPSTPAPAKGERGSFGSAGSRDSSSAAAVDVQKLHSRLKEQFRNQIALFRQGVYLITGFKVDMAQGENDGQVFTVRSVYGEREDDCLVYKWNPKRKNKLDMMSTDMGRLLMNGPSGVYVTQHGSWPGFMASVTLQLFDQQTVM